MKIICPHCKRITELEHVSHGCNVECVCSREFKVDDSTILEEYSEIDSIIPEQIGQYKITEFIAAWESSTRESIQIWEFR